MESDDGKRSFLLKNLLKGFLWLAVVIVFFLLVKKYIGAQVHWLELYLLDNLLVYYLSYTLSELFAGILPPEIFMMLSLGFGGAAVYTFNTAILAFISYTAGLVGFFLGIYFNTTGFFRLMKRRYMARFSKPLRKYASFLVFVAAVTPLPFSAVCTLVGSVGMPLKTFMLAASTRFIRFVLYAYIVWEANMI